ncbi:hypothetical protein [Sporolactobacillus sp. KGMB 08714]|uniref:hypothetical protein n=1 Tax=Sporolactobacillus sp. KGMB 08714 TaxID=3064704 RepID=UPI002FBE0698
MEQNIDRLLWSAFLVAVGALLFQIMKVQFPATLNNIINYWNSLIPGAVGDGVKVGFIHLFLH